MNDDFYLNLAIDEAWKYQGLTYPNPAVGCAIVDKNGQLLALKAHKKAGCYHAELGAVKKALERLDPKLAFPQNPKDLHEFILRHHGNLLKDSTIYVTLEPCAHEGKTPSCAILLKHLNIKKVVIGCEDKNKIASGGAEILKNANIEVSWSGLKKECKELLEPFWAWQRGNFSFFKLAMSSNGVIKGGIITCKSSRLLAHKLRDKCDSLVIGGNTIRIDKPTLDARFCDGRAPDILIYSRKKDFDKNIPLFDVLDRKVFIEDNFDRLKNYKFTMFEGGEGMINALPKEVKWFLIFHAPYFKNSENIRANLPLKLLWQGKVGKDTYGWYKRA
ncbi:MAG: riboflavin biosynthesis protein RibD [Proteobacteria bacterium]|nr:MAG: riboflavin biosynthesis protein RibD [Pseudomonadota bacterium]